MTYQAIPSRWITAHTWALLGYIACFWIAPSSKFQDHWIYFVVTPLALATLIRHGKRLSRLPNREPFYILISLSTLLVLPVFWGEHRESLTESLRQELKDYVFVLALLVTVAISSLRSNRLHQSAIPYLAAAGVAACIPVGYRFLINENITTDGYAGLGNLADNPNEAGLMAGAAALLVLALCLDGDSTRARRWGIATLGLGITLLAAYASEARSAWFSLPAGVAAMVVFRYRLYRTALVTAALVTLLALVFHEPLIEHVSSLSLSGRSSLWAEIFSRVGDQWLLGTGLNDTVNTFNPATNREEEPHSLYVALYYRGGAFALLLFLALTLLALIPAVRGRKPVNPFYLGLLFYGLTNQLVEGVYPINNPNAFWLFTWIPITILALTPESAHDEPHGAVNNEPAI